MKLNSVKLFLWKRGSPIWQTPFARQQIIFCSLLLLLLGWPIATTVAQGNSGITLTAKAGFDGHYKEAYSLPIQINVANSGPTVEGFVRVYTGNAAAGTEVIYDAPISLPTQSDKQLTLFVHLPRASAALNVQLVNESGGIIAQTKTNALSMQNRDALLYAILSSDPSYFDFLENVQGRRSDAAVAFLDTAALPDTAVAWRAIDVLILNDIDTSQLSQAQQQALKLWLNSGGQLIITGGAGWQKTAVSLSDLLPVSINGTETVTDLPAFAQQVGQPFRDPGPYLITTSSLNQGELLYHQEGLPILARVAQGNGTVYFLALDPQLAPLVDWNGSEILFSEIANAIPVITAWATGIQNNYSAESAVTDLPSLVLPSTLQLVILLIIYILVVGPLNYIILKRLNRTELAWTTIPAIVLFFTVVAYFTGFQLKGNDVIINRVSVVHGSVDSEQLHQDSVIGLYSPRRGRYNMQLPLQAVVRPLGADVNTLDSANIDSISRNNELIIKEIQVDVSNMELFTVQSTQPTLALSGQASLLTNGNALELQVQVENNSDLVLENTAVLLGSQAFALGTLAPGESKNISKVVSRASLVNPLGSTFVPETNYGSPLTINADTILGTSNYYDDPIAYPRYQLLEALSLDNNYNVSSFNQLPDGAVILTAWSNESQLPVTLIDQSHDTLGTTLFLLEIPLLQTINTDTQLTLPLALLNWEVIEQNGVYNLNSLNNFTLEGGSATIEFAPWQTFQQMKVATLALQITEQSYGNTITPPQVELWHWQDEVWDVFEVSWGTTQIENPNRYLTDNNVLRVRLQDQSQYGTFINEFYPLLTGTIQ